MPFASFQQSRAVRDPWAGRVPWPTREEDTPRDDSPVAATMQDEGLAGAGFGGAGFGGLAQADGHADAHADAQADAHADGVPFGDDEQDETGGALGAVIDARRAMMERPAGEFCPRKPMRLADTGLTRDFVEQLLCRCLLAHGASSGRALARETALAFRVIEPVLNQLHDEMMVTYRGTAAAGDYEYVLTEAGAERARRYLLLTTYAEAAPVPLEDWIDSVKQQSLTRCNIDRERLERSFDDLMLGDEMLDALGPAVNAGRGMFLYGAPGNGKTSIAERIVRCYGDTIWIPRALWVDGTIIRLFDPVLHEPVADDEGTALLGEPLEDARWIRIRRPTVVVGGELTMEQLDVRHDPGSNVSEAALQMKSNGGILLIDDFGRQAMPAAQLLNRWIVPLEKRYDFQKLATGKKIQVPFDQLIVFSTNLAPRDLVDEAFLRRLPYKIEAKDPAPDEFRRIFRLAGRGLGMHPTDEQVDRLIARHYEATGRPMRCCHPRDLLSQARSWCLYHHRPVELCDEAADFAVRNYFAVM